MRKASDPESVIEFVSRSTGALVSRLVSQLNELAAQGQLARLSDVLWQDQWEDFRCYVAHLWAEKKNLDAVLSDSEQLLRQTFGYTSLRNDPSQRQKADALLDATRAYARKLANMPSGVAELADSTGFSPEGVAGAMIQLRTLDTKLKPSDWAPESLFGEGGRIADLYGVMLSVPQLKRQLDEIRGEGHGQMRISEITRDWVNGKAIDVIAQKYFSRETDDDDGTRAITNACRAIYRTISNSGTWGIAALSRVSGLDFESLTEAEHRRINALPAMIYHGVRTEDAVLMRMNARASQRRRESWQTVPRDSQRRRWPVLRCPGARVPKEPQRWRMAPCPPGRLRSFGGRIQAFVESALRGGSLMKDFVAHDAMYRPRGVCACAIRRPERSNAKPGTGWA